MDIRIKQLTLHNFKGIREAVFAFDGENARIEGENGAGKSTVFDAFTWLLFGKDHRGQDQTNFDIKPIDPETGEHLHGLEHWVEGSLLVDGVERVLRREWAENWVKPKGETEKVLKGHLSRFFVDGVDVVTKAAYDGVIHSWIDEDFFKVITNPLYYIDDRYTDWKTRRKGILAMAGESATAKVSQEFADLLREMRGDTVENFRKRVAAAKKENKARLSEADANIAAWTNILPAAVDVKDITRRNQEILAEFHDAMEAVNTGLADIDKKISDLREADADRRRQIDAKNAEISKIRTAMGEFINEATKRAEKENKARKERLAAKRDEIDNYSIRIAEQERSIRRAAGEIEDAANARAELAVELRELGNKYKAQKEAAFEPSAPKICPTCGQPIPEETTREEFLEKQRETLKAIVNKANGMKAEIADFDKSIEFRKQFIAQCQEDTTALKKKQASAILEEKAMEAGTKIDYAAIERLARGRDEFREMQEKEMALQQEVLSLRGETSSVDTLLAERRGWEQKKDGLYKELSERNTPLLKAKAQADERERILGEIAKEEAKAAGFADEVARLERLEFRTSDYVKAMIEAQEGEINLRFRVARWKMFERTMDGGLVEMCEVTDRKGVPYRSMNDAQKILCGMDVIRVFSEEYKHTAPVFIDNAEGCTQDRFDTSAQVIRLVVKAGASLTMIKE